MTTRLEVSQRFACRVLGQHRWKQRKISKTADDEAALTVEIIDLARQFGRWITAPLVNYPEQTDAATSAARAVTGAAVVDADTEPTTGGEDFAAMLEARPSVFLFVGNGTSLRVHTLMFDFNDELMPIGAAYWISLVQLELSTDN